VNPLFPATNFCQAICYRTCWCLVQSLDFSAFKELKF